MSNYSIKKYIDVEVPLREFIAIRIVQLRKAKGLNQSELSDKITINRTSLCNIESGRQTLMLENLEEICQVLGCKSSDILPF
jgi:DNA-binding Xre family transcriptional regulator